MQAERLFQRAYPPAEGRLRDEAALRGLGEAAGRRQRHKILQPLGFQIHLNIPRYDCAQYKVTATLCRFGIGQPATALAAKYLKALF